MRFPTEFRYFERLTRKRPRAMRAVSRALFGFDPALPNVGALDEVADRMARAQHQRWLAYHLPNRRAEYEPVQEFTR